jgi:methanogenic corrinoid protein MtbC1
MYVYIEQQHAIYALATLFNRPKRQEWVSTHQSSARVQVLWAPILLIHLGGQDGIIAYNIEENELWRRHVLTAVSQVSARIEIYSIYMTFSSTL